MRVWLLCLMRVFDASVVDASVVAVFDASVVDASA